MIASCVGRTIDNVEQQVAVRLFRLGTSQMFRLGTLSENFGTCQGPLLAAIRSEQPIVMSAFAEFDLHQAAGADVRFGS
jgi:hypothetical protein